MAKNSKHRLLFITVFFMVLLCSTACASLIGSVNAAEVTAREKGLSILSNVVGLDLARYGVATEEIQKESQTACVGVVPQDDVCFELMSSGSRLKTLCTFVNGRLQIIHVLETHGEPCFRKPATEANAVEMGRSFLKNYRTYTADALYGELESSLDNVGGDKNVTRTLGDTQLEVTATDDDRTTFKWTYTFNGVKAPSKVVALGFKNGFLNYFVDTWQLYSVGSTSINLSKEEAIALALETAKAYNWSLKLDDDTLDPKNFNESNVRWTALLFDDSVGAGKARSEDALALYPVWRVGIALDKRYGNMYGIEIDIWADTKEVRRIQEAWSTLPPPEGAPIVKADNQVPVATETKLNLTYITMFPAVVGVAMGTVLFWASRKKKLKGYPLLRQRGFKNIGTLVFVLILFTVLVTQAATVKATTRAGIVWGSESTGAGAYPSSWRKHSTEINLQRQVAIDIASYFSANGYAGINHQGIRNPGSSKSQILSDIEYYQNNYDYVAVVAFDHGVGAAPGYPPLWTPQGEFHYMIEDNVGTITGPWTPATYPPREYHLENGVYDMEIYQKTQWGKIMFAFINTCESANLYLQGWLDWGWPPYPGRARGMAFAWTHRLPGIDMSADGYDAPDTGSQVYIGFPSGSASLMQRIPHPDGPREYYWWVGYFFYYALCWDMSVNQALDQASLATWSGLDFGDSPLRNGFTSCWWNMAPGYGSTMAVYGNGNIHLKQFEPDYVSTPVVSGPSAGNIGVSYQFSASSTDPYGHNIRYTFDWGDGSPQTVTGWYTPGATAYASHSWGSGGVYSVTVKAQCANGAWSSWSSPHFINIGNQQVWLTVDAYDYIYGNPLYPNISIDGNWAGYGYVSVQVTAGYHSVLVDDPVWNGYLGCYDYLWCFTDGYGNGQNRPVFSNKLITARYLPSY